MNVAIIIPALDEEESLPPLLAEIPRELHSQGQLCHIETVVVDNGSTDRTAEVARDNGARVVQEPERGYGAACLRGIAALADNPPEIVVFINADRSEYPAELPIVLAPILNDDADLVIGSRVLGGVDPKSMSGLQRFGNWLSTRLMRLVWRVRFTDLGPFRAIRHESLTALGMRDRNFGWTVEMQIRACKHRLRCVEVPVRHRERTAGEQKVSGTLWGSLGAGWKILWTIFAHAVRR